MTTSAFPISQDTGLMIPEAIVHFRTTQISIANTAISPYDRAAGRALLNLIDNGKNHVTANLAEWLQEKIDTGKTEHVILLLRQLSPSH